MTDYYELLQISPNADNDTIHRVFKFLASRLHPDNVHTGDVTKFQQVKSAYDVLSSPLRRREYDAKRKDCEVQPLSISIDFMDQLEGEGNRRMAVLAVLYYRRRMNPNYPDVNLAEIEERMGFPRDYLDFALWYLVKKKYVSKSDNACYSLTADGVDFVEKERLALPVLNRLLTSSTGSIKDPVQETAEGRARRTPNADTDSPSTSTTPPRMDPRVGEHDRRSGVDRRQGAPDWRIIKVERRQNQTDRRTNVKDRNTSN